MGASSSDERAAGSPSGCKLVLRASVWESDNQVIVGEVSRGAEPSVRPGRPVSFRFAAARPHARPQGLTRSGVRGRRQYPAARRKASETHHRRPAAGERSEALACHTENHKGRPAADRRSRAIRHSQHDQTKTRERCRKRHSLGVPPIRLVHTRRYGMQGSYSTGYAYPLSGARRAPSFARRVPTTNLLVTQGPLKRPRRRRADDPVRRGGPGGRHAPSGYGPANPPRARLQQREVRTPQQPDEEQQDEEQQEACGCRQANPPRARLQQREVRTPQQPDEEQQDEEQQDEEQQDTQARVSGSGRAAGGGQPNRR